MLDFPNLSSAEYLVVDCETTGLNWNSDTVFGVAICAPEGEAFYFDIREPGNFKYVKYTLENAKQIVNHNIKFDLHFLRSAGIDIRCPIKCTMVAAALLNEHEQSYSLDKLGQKYLGSGKEEPWVELSAVFGGKPDKGTQIGNLWRAPAGLVAKYAKKDAVLSNGLWKLQEPKLIEESLGGVFDVEMKLTRVLVNMERHGVRVDVDKAHQAVSTLKQEMAKEAQVLRQSFGIDLNFNSSPQLAKVLVKERAEEGHFLSVSGERIPSTENGAPSLTADVLRGISHPIAQSVIKLRKLDKTINTFLLGHILGSHVNGRVHANFNQTKSDNDLGTGSGRISVNAPALQQIHKRDASTASVIRACFLPDEDEQWCCYDWSQMDFRIFAHYVNDQSIIDAYQADPDRDYHQIVADLAGIARDPSKANGGGNAKQINLGMVFGMGSGRLAKEMKLPYTEETVIDPKTQQKRQRVTPGEEAQRIFDKYNAAIPGVRGLLDKASSLAKNRGYVVTALGRRIRFPDGFYHKAAGLVFQGSAADALKVKLVELSEILEGTPAKLILNVHDEFDITMPPGMPDLAAQIRECIQKFDGVGTPLKFRIPIRCDSGMGNNWWEASKSDALPYK